MKTWKELIRISLIRTHSGKDKKFYIEFSDPSCKTNSVLVYNFATDTTKQVNNPLFGFDWTEDIQHYDSSSMSIRKKLSTRLEE